MLKDILISNINRLKARRNNKNIDIDKFERNVLFCHFISGLAAQPLGSFIPFLRDAYGFSYDLSGVLLSCQSIGNLIASMLAGIIPYYIGRRKNVLVFSVWMAVAYFIFASGIGNPIVLIVAFFMTGIARGTNANFNTTMMSSLPGNRAARGYNLVHGFFAIGAFSSPIILIAVTSKIPVHGWRIVALIIAFMCVAQFLNYATMPIYELEVNKGVKTIDTKFLKSSQFWFAAIMLFCYISTEYAIVGWLVTYFKDTGILSANLAQMMNSLFWIVMLFGRLIGAKITGKIASEKILLVDGIGLVIFFLIMFLSRNVLYIVIGLIGTSFFMATIYPQAYAYGGDTVRGNDFANSMMIFTGSIGGIVTPMIVGFIAENAGITAGMQTIIVLTIMMLVSIVAGFTRVRLIKK